MWIWCNCPWPEDIVPQGEPIWMYYEVELGTDFVIRSIDLFADGVAIRDSVARAGGPSLVHASFWSDEEIRQHLTEISEAEFGRVWASAKDKPPV